MIIERNNEWISIISTPAAGYYYVHTIQQVTTLETSLLHSVIVESESQYQFLIDGYFVVSEIALPDSAGSGIWTDGDKIYDENGEISVEDLLEVDPESSNIVREDQGIVTTYYLDEYYHNILESSLKAGLCGKCLSATKQAELDTLMIGLEVIDHLVENEQYYEAQRIIEQLSTCAGLTESNCNCGS